MPMPVRWCGYPLLQGIKHLPPTNWNTYTGIGVRFGKSTFVVKYCISLLFAHVCRLAHRRKLRCDNGKSNWNWNQTWEFCKCVHHNSGIIFSAKKSFPNVSNNYGGLFGVPVLDNMRCWMYCMLSTINMFGNCLFACSHITFSLYRFENILISVFIFRHYFPSYCKRWD